MRQSGETEVTPEMAEAGVEEFCAHYPDTGVGDAQDLRMVTAIYQAMEAIRRGVAPATADGFRLGVVRDI